MEPALAPQVLEIPQALAQVKAMPAVFVRTWVSMDVEVVAVVLVVLVPMETRVPEQVALEFLLQFPVLL